MLKLSDNPPILYPPDAADPSALPGPWWVAHTKARFEKAFAADLAQHDVGYFLPMIERVTFSGGRKRRGMAPLFNGYVFFCGPEQTRYEAMQTNRLAQVLEVRDQPRFVAEITTLHRVLRAGLPLDPYPFAEVGRRCRVTRGPLMGTEGTILRRDDGSTRLVLSVTMLGQGAALEIEADLLEAVGS
jgi:transcription antitermination factor NusG